jgi:hypothetical protein
MTTALRRLPLPVRMAVVFIFSVAFAIAVAALTGDSGYTVAAVTLAQAAVISDDDLQAGVLERFVIESPVLDRLPLKPIEGNSYRYNAEATLPGVEFRAVNAAYSESTGTFVQASEGLVILGGDADVDTFVQATRSNLTDQLEAQIRLKVKAAAYKFQDAVFNGDVAVDANSFDGLKKRLTGAQVIAAGTNGLPVVGNGGTDIQAFLDFLDQLIMAAKVTADNGAIYANDLVIPRLVSAGRRLGLVTDGRVEVLPGITKTQTLYRNIPVLDPGVKLDGTRILPQTETQGASSVTSSIYAVRFGEDEADGAVTGLVNTNHEGANSIEEGLFAVKRLGEQQAKPAHRVRIEGFLGFATFGGQAAARGTGVLAS